MARTHIVDGLATSRHTSRRHYYCVANTHDARRRRRRLHQHSLAQHYMTLSRKTRTFTLYSPTFTAVACVEIVEIERERESRVQSQTQRLDQEKCVESSSSNRVTLSRTVCVFRAHTHGRLLLSSPSCRRRRSRSRPLPPTTLALARRRASSASTAIYQPPLTVQNRRNHLGTFTTHQPPAAPSEYRVANPSQSTHTHVQHPKHRRPPSVRAFARTFAAAAHNIP